MRLNAARGSDGPWDRRCERSRASVIGAWTLTARADRGRDSNRIDDLLKALAELRELDQKRQAHAPGSSDYDTVSTMIDQRTQQVMDQFRGLAARPQRSSGDERNVAEQGSQIPRPRQARPE